MNVFVIVFVIVFITVIVFVFVFVFVFVIVFVFVSPRRPSRSSNLVPRLAVVGVVLLAILADRQQPANKNTVDYDVVPAGGVEPPQGRAGRGMG